MAHCISCTTNQCVIVATCTNIDFFAFLVLTYTMPHCMMSSSQEHDNTNHRRETDMAEYYISHNDYFGFCVIEEIDGTGKIVFAGSIEDCNRKCIELNNTL